MNTASYKTKSANNATIKKEWLIVDGNDEILGRLASKVAFLLRGKHKTDFTPHVDTGDYVIVINAEKIKLTGNKWTQKEYVSHSGYPGGQKKINPQELIKKKPISVVEKAVKGMLPKSRLGSELYRNLYVYAGNKHPHEAQKPNEINLSTIIK